MFLDCWPIFRPAASHVARHVRRHRIGRVVRHAAYAATSKPAIIGFVCVVLPGGFWAGWPSAGLPTPGGQPTGQYTDIAPSLPTEYPSSLLYSPRSGGASAAPEAESRQAVAPSRGRRLSIPEPASLTLLVTALASLVVWRFR